MNATIHSMRPPGTYISVRLHGAFNSKRNAQVVARQLTDTQRRATCIRVAHRVTPTLLRLLRIPGDGSGLVLWLADATCRSNAEAVEAWVEAQLHGYPDLQVVDRDAMAELTDRLRHRLSQFQDSCHDD